MDLAEDLDRQWNKLDRDVGAEIIAEWIELKV
jgi:hypothetical protein